MITNLMAPQGAREDLKLGARSAGQILTPLGVKHGRAVLMADLILLAYPVKITGLQNKENQP